MSTPTPQKIRKQRHRFLVTAIMAVAMAAAFVAIFVCSWPWQVLVGR